MLWLLFTLAVLAPIPLAIAFGYAPAIGAAGRTRVLVIGVATLAVGVVSLWLATGGDDYAGGHFWETWLSVIGFVVGGFGLGALGGWLAQTLGVLGWVIAVVAALLAILVEATWAIALLMHIGGFA